MLQGIDHLIRLAVDLAIVILGRALLNLGDYTVLSFLNFNQRPWVPTLVIMEYTKGALFFGANVLIEVSNRDMSHLPWSGSLTRGLDH